MLTGSPHLGCGPLVQVNTSKYDAIATCNASPQVKNARGLVEQCGKDDWPMRLLFSSLNKVWLVSYQILEYQLVRTCLVSSQSKWIE
jgi:hypothetical protein